MRVKPIILKKGYQIIKSDSVILIKKKIRSQIIKASKLILEKNNYKNCIFKNINKVIEFMHSEDKKKNLNMIASLYEILPAIPEIHKYASKKFFVDLAKRSGILYPAIGVNLAVRLDRPHDEKRNSSLHQVFWYSFISNNSITVWFNLTEVKKEDGPLIIYYNFKKNIKKFKDNKLGTFTASLPLKKKIGKKNIFLKENEVLVFNQFLLHQSGQNISTKPRISVQIRFNDLKKAKELKSSFTCVSSDYVLKKQKLFLLN